MLTRLTSRPWLSLRIGIELLSGGATSFLSSGPVPLPFERIEGVGGVEDFLDPPREASLWHSPRLGPLGRRPVILRCLPPTTSVDEIR